jgi:hypothetical protein
MTVKPSTLGLVFVAVLLGGVVYLVQTQSSSRPPNADSLNGGSPNAETASATSSTTQKLFAFEEKQVQSFTLKTQLRSLSFKRDSNGKWQMTEPDATPADDAAIAYLLNLLATGSSSRTFEAPTTRKEDFGFHQPMATIDLKLDNNETHRLIIGGYDFDRSRLYAQADPPTDAANLSVLLVSPDFDNAVNRPLADWKVKPESSKNSSPSPSPSSPSPSP